MLEQEEGGRRGEEGGRRIERGRERKMGQEEGRGGRAQERERERGQREREGDRKGERGKEGEKTREGETAKQEGREELRKSVIGKDRKERRKRLKKRRKKKTTANTLRKACSRPLSKRPLCGAGIMTVPLFQMTRLRPGEVGSFAQGHSASKSSAGILF